MKPVKQTVTGRSGNCFAARVASILEVPIESLPNHFKDDEGNCEPRWLDQWNEFLKPYGLGMMWADVMFARVPLGYAIAEMEVKDHHSNHAVVCRDGQIVHDPLGPDYPAGRFVNWFVFITLDAAKLRQESSNG